jgi:hypothetical protein
LRYITLRQVHQRVAQRQPGPFRVLLRLTGYLPRDLKQWCRPLPPAIQQQQQQQQQQATGDGEAAGAGSSSQQQQPLSWEWAAHLLLEDATGSSTCRHACCTRFCTAQTVHQARHRYQAALQHCCIQQFSCTQATFACTAEAPHTHTLP